MSETVPLDLSVDRVRVFLDGEIVGSLSLSPAFAHGASSASERNRPLLYRNLDEAVHCGIKRYGSLGI